MGFLITIRAKGVVDVVKATTNLERKQDVWQATRAECIRFNVDTSFVECINATSVGSLPETHQTMSLSRCGILLGFVPMWRKHSFWRVLQVFILDHP